jgi:MFS family permease
MSGATIAPGLPGLVAHFNDYPDAEFLSRLILTAPGLAIACSASLAGWVADKLGRRVLLQVGIVIYILAGSTGLWVDDLIVLLISRFTLGISVGMVMVSSMALLTDHFQGPERDRAMGQQSSAMATGAIVFITLGSVLADISWRAPFAVYLLPMLLIPMVYFIISKPPPSEKSEHRLASTFPVVHAIMLYALAFFSMVMFYFIPSQLPFLAQELGAQSLKIAGFAVVVNQIFSALASAYYQRLRKYLNNRQILLLSYTLMCTGFFLLSQAQSLLEVFVSMPLIGIGLGFNFPNLTIWLMSRIPSDMRGRASGGMASAVFIGQFLSPLISQPVVNAYNLSTAYATASIAMFALIILPIFLITVYRKLHKG